MDYNNKPKNYYNFERKEMLELLPKNARCILEVGCGQGAFVKQIKEVNKDSEVWGIEFMPEEAEIAKKYTDKMYVGPCEDHIDSLPDNYFDTIFFNDVLEHLTYPDKVLKNIKSKLKDNGVVISSIPNLRNFRVLKMLVVNGEWNYADHGIMDKTHLRWFTKRSIKKMYENCGYNVTQHFGINPSKSLKPILYNIPLLFRAMDIKYLQFATVAKVKE